ncbi:cyclase [Crossiella equi]|uniref:Cyclase n=1 Tax=Crossiella equi TaxID=130796 RepID=A0ABS5AF64_9PSEU|nr:MBL fold metallo-hydrolase [Crossiella equi]MBP2474325.1 cyclase [Crossiella equi]
MGEYIEHVTGVVRAYIQEPGGWFLNNAGWVAGTERTLLVDTLATEARTQRLLAALHADAGAKPLTAAITHAHGDHANGANQVSALGGAVLATSPAAVTIAAGPHTYDMAFECSTWGDISPAEITETVTSPLRLDLGGLHADVLPVPGKAHTDGDLVVHVPGEGVLFTGDLVFAEVTPLALHGSLRGWLAALEWLAALPHEHLVPGHGPVLPAGSTHLEQLAEYLQWLLDNAERPGADRVAKQQWAHWSEGERHVANLVVAAAELRGEPVSLPAVISAMLTEVGGRIPLAI